MDARQPEEKMPARRPEFPYGSPLYLFTQMLAATINLNLVLPAVLQVSFKGSIYEQGVFLLVYGTAFMVMSIVFLAVAGYFAIMFVIAGSLRKLARSDVRNPNVAKAIAIRVLLSNQPRWVISLAPCVVPASSLAILICFFYRDKLALDDNLMLLEACLLQGLTAFVLSMPFILRTQRLYGTNVLTRGELNEEDGKIP